MQGRRGQSLARSETALSRIAMGRLGRHREDSGVRLRHQDLEHRFSRLSRPVPQARKSSVLERWANPALAAGTASMRASPGASSRRDFLDNQPPEAAN
jgi:hypothetical protein